MEGKDPQVEARNVCDTETELCRSEEGELWDGRDQCNGETELCSSEEGELWDIIKKNVKCLKVTGGIYIKHLVLQGSTQQ